MTICWASYKIMVHVLNKSEKWAERSSGHSLTDYPQSMNLPTEPGHTTRNWPETQMESSRFPTRPLQLATGGFPPLTLSTFVLAQFRPSKCCCYLWSARNSPRQHSHTTPTARHHYRTCTIGSLLMVIGCTSTDEYARTGFCSLLEAIINAWYKVNGK